MFKGMLYRKLVEGRKQNGQKVEDPLLVAKLRFAKGEITKEQFLEIKKEILNSN